MHTAETLQHTAHCTLPSAPAPVAIARQRPPLHPRTAASSPPTPTPSHHRRRLRRRGLRVFARSCFGNNHACIRIALTAGLA
jgi:hypothetical protein